MQSMDYQTFAQRLQETLLSTEVPLTSAMIAYLYKISPEQASVLLQQAAQEGLIKQDHQLLGIPTYIAPNKTPVFETIPPSPDRGGSFPAQTPFVPPPLVQQDPILGTSTVPSTGNSFPSEEEEARQETASSQYTRCPFCHESILIGSRKCRYCLEYLDPALRSIYNRNRSSADATTTTNSLVRFNQRPTTLAPANATSTQAALLSFFMPGLGQMTTGQIASGVLWMALTCFGYAYYVIPGLILHVLCVINAYKEAQAQQTQGNKP